jgi:hypothetical protein
MDAVIARPVSVKQLILQPIRFSGARCFVNSHCTVVSQCALPVRFSHPAQKVEIAPAQVCRASVALEKINPGCHHPSQKLMVAPKGGVEFSHDLPALRFRRLVIRREKQRRCEPPSSMRELREHLPHTVPLGVGRLSFGRCV